MSKIETSFIALTSKIKLTDGQRQQVQDRMSKLTSLLQQNFATPKPVPIGSYSRGTLVPPGNDADVLFVWPDAPKNPRSALTELQALLAPHYNGVTLRVQSHSVGIRYVEGIALDVVPARTSTNDAYEIPDLDDPNDAKSTTRWLHTEPKKHVERVTASNGVLGGIAATLIAALKQANATQALKLKSFHLESMVLSGVDAHQVHSRTLAAAAHEALGWLAKKLCGDTDAKYWPYLEGESRKNIANRYANWANSFAEALRTDDVNLTKKVFPLL
jgi:hypothetical protein